MLNSRTGTIDGLFYEVTGEGEPILFIHGIGGSHEMFHPQVKELSEKGYRCITIDLKGSGASKSPGTRHYLEAHVESIDALLQELSIPKDKKALTIVGLSYGGIVSQCYTIKNPQTVKKLVLMDTYGNLVPDDFQDAALTLFGAAIALAPWLPKKFVRPFFNAYKKWSDAHEEMMKIVNTWRKKDMTLMLLEVFGKNFLRDLNALEIPTLVIVGDFIPTVVEKSKEILANLPYGSLEVIPDSMDPTNLCQPKLVNKHLVKFLTDTEFKPNDAYIPLDGSAVQEMPNLKIIA